jgi:lipoprotein-anchoring transpeptidase ErfK/SrfK
LARDAPGLEAQQAGNADGRPGYTAAVKRAALLVLLAAFALAGAAAAYALADSPPPGPTGPTGTTTDDTTTTTSTTRPTPAPPPKRSRIAPGVTISGIHVGGLAFGPAYSAVSVEFRSELEVRLGDRLLTVSPWRLGAKPFIGPAVSRALKAKPGTAVMMVVDVRRPKVAAYVDGLRKRFDREVDDAHVVLRAMRPVVVPEVVGNTVRRDTSITKLVVALQRNKRAPVVLSAKVTEPTVTAASFGPIIVIRRDSKWLYLYKQVSPDKPVAFWRRFQVATGQAVYPTPLGAYDIVNMQRDPWWFPPPDAEWAQGAKPIPPGPGNPLGTRWMGLSAPGVGIHGTPDPASLGYSASHGCIRMFIPSAEWLFKHVQVGTPVFIVPA